MIRGIRLKPAGWLALIVVVVLVGSGTALTARAIWVQIRGLRALRPYEPLPVLNISSHPTDTPVPTVVPPPTPRGWTRQTDFAGQKYLAPPPEVEAEIREAFEAVLMCDVIEDVPDEMAIQYDREAALGAVEQVAVPRLVDWCRQKTRVALVNLGPENPVECDDYTKCTVARAKFGPAAGAILYDDPMCRAVGFDGAPCVTRSIGDDNPYQLYIATIELQDGVWRVTDWQVVDMEPPPQD